MEDMYDIQNHVSESCLIVSILGFDFSMLSLCEYSRIGLYDGSMAGTTFVSAILRAVCHRV